MALRRSRVRISLGPQNAFYGSNQSSDRDQVIGVNLKRETDRDRPNSPISP